MTPTEYCRRQTAAPGSDFYYATLFLPQQHKRVFNALFALQSELDQIITECSDPGIARIKLQWWRDELTRLSNAQPRHPVCLELNQLPVPIRPDYSKLNAHVEHVEWMLSGTQPESYAALKARLVDGPALLWRIAMQVCGVADRVPGNHAAETAALTMLLRIFQNSRPLIKNGICLLPKQEMETHRLDIYNVTGNSCVKQRRRMFTELFTCLEQDIAENYQALTGQQTSALLFSTIMNRLLSTLCMELRKSGYPLMETKTALTPVRKLWIAWMAKWKSKN